MTTSADSGASISVLRLPSFRWLIASTVFATLASEIQSVVVSWQIYTLTGDPRALGFIGLCGAIPFIGTVLFAGHVADIRNRRSVAILALAALLLCTLTLLALSASGMIAAHHWLIYAVIMVAAVARSFLAPARSALATEVVPHAQFEAAVKVRAGSWQLGAVSGRAGSGFVYGLGLTLGLGAAFSYGVIAVLLLLAITALALVHHVPAPPRASTEPVLTSLRTGISYVLTQRILLGAMILDLLAVLFGDAVAVLPIFADNILHVGLHGLGMLKAAPAAGAVLMWLILAMLPPLPRAGPTLLWAVAGFGAAMIGFGLSTSFLLSLILLALSGAMDYISVVLRGTLVQVITPRHLLGRVTSVQQVFVGSSNEIGSFESGQAAYYMGLVPSVVFGGAVTLAVVVGVAWTCPGLRRLGRIMRPAE